MIELIINIALFAIGMFVLYYVVVFSFIGAWVAYHVIAAHYDKILIAISVIVGISYVAYTAVI